MLLTGSVDVKDIMGGFRWVRLLNDKWQQIYQWSTVSWERHHFLVSTDQKKGIANSHRVKVQQLRYLDSFFVIFKVAVAFYLQSENEETPPDIEIVKDIWSCVAKFTLSEIQIKTFFFFFWVVLIFNEDSFLNLLQENKKSGGKK